MSGMFSKIKLIMNEDSKDIICCILCILISTELFYSLIAASEYTKEESTANENECKKKCTEDINCGFYNYNNDNGNCSMGKHPLCRKVNILNISSFMGFIKKIGIAIVFILCNISFLMRKNTDKKE